MIYLSDFTIPHKISRVCQAIVNINFMIYLYTHVIYRLLCCRTASIACDNVGSYILQRLQQSTVDITDNRPLHTSLRVRSRWVSLCEEKIRYNLARYGYYILVIFYSRASVVVFRIT